MTDGLHIKVVPIPGWKYKAFVEGASPEEFAIGGTMEKALRRWRKAFGATYGIDITNGYTAVVPFKNSSFKD